MPPPDYDFDQLMGELASARQQYSEQARGPEKWVVLQEMTKNLENLKKGIEKIKGYQKKVIRTQQRPVKDTIIVHSWSCYNLSSVVNGLNYCNVYNVIGVRLSLNVSFTFVYSL